MGAGVTRRGASEMGREVEIEERRSRRNERTAEECIASKSLKHVEFGMDLRLQKECWLVRAAVLKCGLE
jgi:hypothetical protein